jgi:NAD-dependent aldehyde dehydrogenases
VSILDEPIKRVLRLKNYINGEWVEPESNTVRDVVNPATMKVIGKTPLSSAKDVDTAVEAARAAFPEWRKTTPLTRARYFFRLKDLLEEHFEEISRVGVMEGYNE